MAKKGCIAWNKGLKRTWNSPGEFRKGGIPWNKGKTGLQVAWNKGLGGSYPEKTRIKMSLSAKKRKRFPLSEETKQKIRLANTGKKPSVETIEKLRISHLGKPSGRKGKPVSKAQIEKHSETMKKLWSDPIYKEKNLKLIFETAKPNKVELKFQDLLDEHFPNTWKYVGDGQIWIAGKCPDFLNTNSRKLIEFFGTFWHKPEDEEIRKSHFSRYGYNTLVVWDYELKNE